MQTQMENGDLILLLKFAQLIQQRIKIETNQSAKESLEKDLILVKDEIGRKILDLPRDVQIFPPYDSSQFFDDKLLYPNKEPISSINCNEYQQPAKKTKSSISVSPINSPARSNRSSKLQSLSGFVDDNNSDSSYLNNDDNQSLNETSIRSFPGQPSPFMDYTTEDIAAKFNQFIKQKESKKSKESKIPKPKSKIPIPKQK